MATTPNNCVKMIGPKGKVSYVSRKASQSRHLANLGFMIAHDQDEQVKPIKLNTRPDAGKA